MTNKSKPLKNQKIAYGYALLAVILWSTVSSAFKITLRHVSFDQMLLWATLTGTVMLTFFKSFSKTKFRESDFSFRAVGTSAFLGFINPFLYYLLLFKAYDLLTAQEAVALNYMWLLFLVIFSAVFLHQKIPWTGFAALFVSFAGIIVVITRGDFSQMHFSNIPGVIMVVASAIIFASYWIFNMRDHRDDLTKIWMNLIFGTVYIITYHLILYKKIEVPDLSGFAGSVYIGLFEMSITFVVWLRALNLSENTAKVSNIVFLSPFLALFWISNTVGEAIKLSTVAGLVLIISGIGLQQYASLKNKTGSRR